MNSYIKEGIKEYFIILSAAFIVLSISIILTSDYSFSKNFITGFGVLNSTCNNDNICDSEETPPGCYDCLKREGDTVSKGDYFALNYNSVCNVILKFQNIQLKDDGNIAVHISDESGNVIEGFPADVNLSDSSENGYLLNLQYKLYGRDNLKMVYKLRVNKDTQQIYLEDTTQDCPPFCGNNFCEYQEGFTEPNYCKQDCIKKEKEHVFLNGSNRDRFFEVNYNKECRGVFKFNDYYNGNFDIWEYDPLTKNIKKYPKAEYNISNTNSNGFLVILPHGRQLFYLRYNSASNSIYLESTEKSCTVDCTALDQKNCTSISSYKTCVKDTEGYTSFSSEIFCGSQKVCNTDVNPSNPCVENCTNECQQGSKACVSSTETKACGNFDTSDWCLEWGDVAACPEWHKCVNGDCVKNCTDECTNENKTICYNNTVIKSCANINEDPCLELQIVESCPEKSVCRYNQTKCECEEKWACTDWSECTEGIKSRTCYDENNCGTAYEKANFSESASCISALACNPVFEYGGWGECTSEGKRHRYKIYSETCGLSESYVEETEDCTYISPITEQPAENISTIDLAQNPESAINPLPLVDTSYIAPQIEEPTPEKRSYMWFIFIFISLFALGAGVLYYKLDKSKSNLAQEKQSSKLDKDSSEKLRDYVKNMVAYGYSTEQIKQLLLKEGWNQAILSGIFKEISPKDVNSQLKNYIGLMRSKGYNDIQISSELEKQGWKKDDIKKGFI